MKMLALAIASGVGTAGVGAIAGALVASEHKGEGAAIGAGVGLAVGAGAGALVAYLLEQKSTPALTAPPTTRPAYTPPETKGAVEVGTWYHALFVWRGSSWSVVDEGASPIYLPYNEVSSDPPPYYFGAWWIRTPSGWDLNYTFSNYGA